MKLSSATHDTPIGPFTVIAGDEDGERAVLAAGFTADPEELRARLHKDWLSLPLERAADGRLGEVSDALDAYFGGDPKALEGLPVRQRSNQRMLRAWEGLRTIPAGETRSYRDLAVSVFGDPDYARLAGGACAKNLVALIVPCHRVIRSDGDLGGYYYGLDRKRWLLQHERSLAQQA
jgi:methylated-DNA-[protein]-cysteine S-methyltransferase